MSLVKNSWGNALSVQQPQGLGFSIFGKKIKVGKWLGKAVGYIGGIVAGAASTFIPVFGEDVAGLIRQAVKEAIKALEESPSLNGAYLNGADDGELTDYETGIFNEWLPRFGTFTERLLIDVGDAMALPSANSQIIALNAVLNKIDGVQDHYTVSDKDVLSQNAIDQRSYLIWASLEPVYRAVQMAVATLGLDVEVVPVQFSITAYDFTPLFTTSIVTKINGQNYKLIGNAPVKLPVSVTMPTKPIFNIGNTLPTKRPAVNLSNTTKPTTLPTTTPPIKTPIKTALPTTTNPVSTPAPTPATTVGNGDGTVTLPVSVPVNTGNNTPVTTPVTEKTNEATTADPEKKGNGKFIIGGVLLALGIYAVTRKKKKGTKPSNK